MSVMGRQNNHKSCNRLEKRPALAYSTTMASDIVPGIKTAVHAEALKR